MKIMVPIKRVIDYRVKVRLNSDNSAVQSDGVKHSINPFDEIALEQAIQCLESGIASEILAVSIGASPVQETLRTALAMGATRALHISTDAVPDGLAIAQALSEVVKAESIELVLCGKQAIDDDRHQVPQMLAALLQYPQATCASEISIESNTARVVRETDHGLETLTLPLPAIISCDLRLNEPRFVSLPNIMKAKAKTIEQRPFDALSVDASPRHRITALSTPATRQRGVMVETFAELLPVINNKEHA